MVGTTLPEMGGTEYSEHIHDHVGGRVPRVNLKIERRLQRTLLRILRTGLVKAAHDISKGGLAVSLAEMAIQGDKGFNIDLDEVPSKTLRTDQLLFSETRSRFILESTPRNTGRILSMFRRSGIRAARIGTVKSGSLDYVRDSMLISVPFSTAKNAWSQAVPLAMETFA